MMKKSRLIAVLLLLCLLFPLGAQGQAESGQQKKEIELRWASIWVGNDSKAPAVEALVEEFNTNNAGKIKVVIEPQPDYNAYEQKFAPVWLQDRPRLTSLPSNSTRLPPRSISQIF